MPTTWKRMTAVLVICLIAAMVIGVVKLVSV
jgi:hypothetical protein